MMKQICTPLWLACVSLSGVAQESAAPRVAIPLIVSDSHHRPTSVTVESLVITDQKTLVTGASLVRGVDLPLELGVLIDSSLRGRKKKTLGWPPRHSPSRISTDQKCYSRPDHCSQRSAGSERAPLDRFDRDNFARPGRRAGPARLPAVAASGPR
jgi:hypothetical protein